MTITFLKKRICLPRFSTIFVLGFFAFSCYQCTTVKSPITSLEVLENSTPKIKTNPTPSSNKIAISQVSTNQLLGVDISNLATGFYVLAINGNNLNHFEKIIKH